MRSYFSIGKHERGRSSGCIRVVGVRFTKEEFAELLRINNRKADPKVFVSSL